MPNAASFLKNAPFRRLLASSLTVLFLLTQGAGAEPPPPASEIGRQVKAAYLYKFTSFIEWPPGTFADTKSPIAIGVMGDDTLADDLERLLAGRTVNGRPLVVLKPRRSDDSMAALHILFIGRLDKNKLLEVFSGLKGLPILTVTDSDEAYALGSMINFVVTGDTLRFEVALKPAVLSRIKISALMLAAAYKVMKEDL